MEKSKKEDMIYVVREVDGEMIGGYVRRSSLESMRKSESKEENTQKEEEDDGEEE